MFSVFFLRLAVPSCICFSVQSNNPLDIIMRFLSILVLAELGFSFNPFRSLSKTLFPRRGARNTAPAESPVGVAELNEEVFIPRANDPMLRQLNRYRRTTDVGQDGYTYENTDEETRNALRLGARQEVRIEAFEEAVAHSERSISPTHVNALVRNLGSPHSFDEQDGVIVRRDNHPMRISRSDSHESPYSMSSSPNSAGTNDFGISEPLEDQLDSVTVESHIMYGQINSTMADLRARSRA